jgi:hypothetical protein
MLKKSLLALALVAASSAAFADPVRFNFRFAEESPGTAQAVGYIVFETDLLNNPGFNDLTLPNPAVLDLSVTVSGATAGNGTFGLADFCDVAFDSGGLALDLTRELVGQPTLSLPWGTPPGKGGGNATQGEGPSTEGDFNLFSSCMLNRTYAAQPTGTSGAPQGTWYYTLGADGGNADQMLIVSMAPAAAGGPVVRHPVPAANFWTLAGLFTLIAGFGVAATRSRSA